MTKDQLYQEIQRVRSQINRARDEQRTLEEKWDVLLEFSAKCNERAEAFLESVQRRKKKLSGIDQLLSRMKAAMKYREKMQDLLCGQDYRSAKNSIDELMDNLDRQKRQVKQALSDVDHKLRQLHSRLNQLQYEYNNYPDEEDANDG